MTHPIVEAAARARWDATGTKAWDRLPKEFKQQPTAEAKAAVLAALKMMRSLTHIQDTLLLGTSTTALTLALLIQGYIDAVIREIEA